MTNSQITNKSNYLTKFLKNCNEFPDIFTILAKKSIDHDIFIKIPETLLYSSHGKNPIFLFNCPEGYICSDSSESSVSLFFSLVEKRSSPEARNFPLFIHKSKGGGDNLYFDSRTARKEFEECPYRYHMLQRYIRVGSKSAWKVCIDWVEGSIKYFTLVNNSHFMQNNLNKTFGPNDRFIRGKNDNKRYLINSKEIKSYHIVESLQPIQTLSKTAKESIPALNKLIYNSKPVYETIADFIKEHNNNWIFIGIQGCILKGHSTKSFKASKNIIPLKSNFPVYPTISFTREKSSSSLEDTGDSALARVENRRISKISRKIFRKATSVNQIKISKPPKVILMTKEEEYSFYLKQKSSDSQGRIPFNMIGIVPQNIGSHLTYFIEKNKQMIPKSVIPSGTPLGMYSLNEMSVKSNLDYLNRISAEFDSKLSNISSLKQRRNSVSQPSKASETPSLYT